MLNFQNELLILENHCISEHILLFLSDPFQRYAMG